MNPIISGALPYGADPDPMATKRHQPPCLGCSEFQDRVQRAKLRTSRSYTLPRPCRACQSRLDYADATDPSRQRYVPKGRKAQALESGKVSGYKVAQGDGFYQLLDKRAADFGWPDGFVSAMDELRAEGCSWRIIGHLFGISRFVASRTFNKRKQGAKTPAEANVDLGPESPQPPPLLEV